MGYLLTQMAIYMIVTFLLGLILGWLFWRYGRETATVDADRYRQNSRPCVPSVTR